MTREEPAKRTVSDRETTILPTEPAGAEFADFALEDAEDSRALKGAMSLAVGFHLLFLLINFPSFGSRTEAVEESDKKIYVVQQYRFEKKLPPKKVIPPKRVKRMPVPDETPDDPEPIRLDEPPTEIELPEVDIDVFAFPPAPPMPEEQTGPIQVGGEVKRPEKLYAPQPRYTEIARKARIEGLVILQAIIDRQGMVTHVKILRGLPMGLSEETIKTVKLWRFKPATLRGKPVDVYFNLTVNFRLQ